jgi:hypothetical protein
MRLIYHPEAEAEMVEAAGFYEGRVLTLGAQYLTAVDAAVRDILASPTRGRLVETDVRCYRMKRFPYTIYYRILPAGFQIVAFKHHRRRPDYWRARLAG